ncbi:MAG: nucleotidyltransferase substrate binding protein [Caldilineaceae bacterium]|nr:nucleotidyltransferase substrate binding protein [Caldilineaceae bacterium]
MRRSVRRGVVWSQELPITISTKCVRRCIHTLKSAWEGLHGYEPSDVLNEIFQAACVKEFELVLDQSGRLLQRRLRPYFASNRQADQLSFNDIFRYAARHCLISEDACERWLEYRANRNETAHEYGEHFAEKTLELLPQFIADADALVAMIEEVQDD